MIRHHHSDEEPGESTPPDPVDAFLAQPPFVEDAEMEKAHVVDEDLEEERIRTAEALATGHENR